MAEAVERLSAIPNLTVSQNVALSRYTRFGLGGPAAALAEASTPEAFVAAIELARASGLPWTIVGGGTNLIVSDRGFPGLVLRLTAAAISADGSRVRADAGASLQDLVDFTIGAGLAGLETMTGIPGSVGAAVYGNAGAYGRSISQSASRVRFFDGAAIREFDNAECEFAYRESVFKRRKECVIFSVELSLQPADHAELRQRADEILRVRNQKYPPTMKCAGSIFKNLLLDDLPEAVAGQVPPAVVREGKVPAAYFLDQVGAKGTQRGDIHVADYHANLIYNAGAGAADDLVSLVDDLKARVRRKFGLELEEEVQYVGF
ncbi:MAG: UDP-N-acetylmuramate dehydrogenase [Bryobacteraceae bacterium]|nr:UDP-N-acetylmuramate dehydrogenase [Bryobacteraceae bacterium]